MKRLTMKDENGCFLTDKTATVTWNSLIGENRYRGEAVDRLAAIEDILCDAEDEYDLDRLAVMCNQRMSMRDEVSERFSVTAKIPLDRLRKLVEADREGRCVVMEDLTISDLQQMLIVLDATCYGDGAETYTTGYRNGHRNGRIEILRHVLEIPEGDSSDTESALKARKQDG